MMKLGVQLYSVRDAITVDYLGILQKIADFGYRLVEPAGNFGPGIQQAKAWYSELGLSVVSMHTGLPLGDDRDKILRDAEALDCRDIIAGKGPDAFETVDKTRKACEDFNSASAIVRREGRRLGYHNHWWEVQEVAGSGKTVFDFLVDECPDLIFELDTYWARVGGADAAATIQRLGARCAHLHVKDGPGAKGQPNVAVGAGVMEWGSVFAAAKKCEGAFVEFDKCATDVVQAVGESAKYLIKKGFVYGN